jgi:hypothetical protein
LLISRSKITTFATINDSLFIIEDRTQGNFQTINRFIPGEAPSFSTLSHHVGMIIHWITG